MTQVLIIKPSALGDIVHALQVATSLKEQVPDIEISWVARDILTPFVRSCEAVDHVFVFKRHGGVFAFWRLTTELRKKKYDYVLDMQSLLRTGFMAFRSRAAKKIGRADAREGSSLFYDEKVAPAPLGRRPHMLEKLLPFCVPLGAKPELRGILNFREDASLNLSHLDGPNGLRPIVMFPDSRRPDKRWHGFKQLTEAILRDDRRRRVIWAGANYVPDKDAFQPSQFLNLTGNTSVVSLPALVQRAACVISNESGAMHLAAALQVPVLAILGRSDPEVLGPYPYRGATNHAIQAPLGDLRLLSVKDVFARFKKLQAGSGLSAVSPTPHRQ
ncbi:MAG TPA: glycosyltransferase family 9 protein [Opitutaceae bacterium]|nr:glycosyltransferase family 9 protein [Opitutaceae bacterium]